MTWHGEIPERIEREMFESRSRMAPDVKDLKKHTGPPSRLARTAAGNHPPPDVV